MALNACGFATTDRIITSSPSFKSPLSTAVTSVNAWSVMPRAILQHVLPRHRKSLRLQSGHDLTRQIVHTELLCRPDLRRQRVGRGRYARRCTHRHRGPRRLAKDSALVYIPPLDLEVHRRYTPVRRMPVLVAIDRLQRIIDVRGDAS